MRNELTAERKMENLALNIDLLIFIIKEKEYQIESFVMVYHVYRSSKEKDILNTEIDPSNVVDKFAVVIKNNTTTVGHLPQGKTGRFCKTVFYFLKIDNTSCKVVITSPKAVNLGDGLGMRIPCKLTFRGQSQFVDILEQELCKHE